jgi:dsRNA-specific ribonuclease
VQNILKTYGITAEITNFELYKRAFVHKSYIRRPTVENEKNNIVISAKPDNCVPLFTKSNERLEFMGGRDSGMYNQVLPIQTVSQGKRRVHEKKIALVKNESIGRMAYEMGCTTGLSYPNTQRRSRPGQLQETGVSVRGVSGALFLDFNKITVKDEHGGSRTCSWSVPGSRCSWRRYSSAT